MAYLGEVKTATEGFVWGDILLTSPALRSNGPARTLTYAEVASLTRESLEEAAELHPEAVAPLRRSAMLEAMSRATELIAKAVAAKKERKRLAGLSEAERREAEAQGKMADVFGGGDGDGGGGDDAGYDSDDDAETMLRKIGLAPRWREIDEHGNIVEVDKNTASARSPTREEKALAKAAEAGNDVPWGTGFSESMAFSSFTVQTPAEEDSEQDQRFREASGKAAAGASMAAPPSPPAAPSFVEGIAAFLAPTSASGQKPDGGQEQAGSGGWSSTLELSKLKAVLNLMRKDMLLSQALAMESYDAVSSLGGPRRGLAQCTRTPRFNLHSRHTSARLLALCAD